MTTVRAWLFIFKIWNMLQQLSSWHNNGQSIGFNPLGMKHALLVVIASCQWSEHGYLSLRYETCSDSWHRLMTTVRAWLFIFKIWNMLQQLSSWHNNGQSIGFNPLGMKHAPLVVIVSWQRSEHGTNPLVMNHAPSDVIASWQRSEHGYSSLMYETCSVSCHRDMTTVRAWLFISKVWNMLR